MGFLTGHELKWMPEALRILRHELPNIDVMVSSQYSPLLEYERPKSIFALRVGSRRVAANTSAFIDFLVEIFAKNPQFVL
jgi:hypothetical protein